MRVLGIVVPMRDLFRLTGLDEQCTQQQHTCAVWCATWLRTLRNESGLTLAELGDKIGVSSYWLMQLEAGAVRPSAVVVSRLLEWIGSLPIGRPVKVAK